MNVSSLRKLIRLRKVPQSQCTSYSIICIFKYDVIHAMPPHYRLPFHSPHPHEHSSHNRAGKIVLGTNVALDSPTFDAYYLILLNLIVSSYGCGALLFSILTLEIFGCKSTSTEELWIGGKNPVMSALCQIIP